MQSRLLRFGSLCAVLVLAAVGCGGDDSGDDGDGDTAPDAATSTHLTGTVTYDYVNANDDSQGGGLALGTITQRPARRMIVDALAGGATVVSTLSDDNGAFALDVPLGMTVTLRVEAASLVTNYTADAIGTDTCKGASWDVAVLDNTSNEAKYVLDSPTEYSASTGDIAIHATLAFDGTTYTDRTAAPFAILDTVLTEMELACEGKADTQFPTVRVEWSVNNTNVFGAITSGQIGTSYYTGAGGMSRLFILGKENVDTDEYDDHVIAHELGHYLEDRLFRSDSIGGTHSSREVVDPRVAFGEGYGNAVSGMTFNDPHYVDTFGAKEKDSFEIPLATAPTTNDRGVYSETSVQYFLWKLYDGRDTMTNHGSFERIYNILLNFQKTTPGFTNVQSFAAYYNQEYGGAAEGLQSLWSTGLATSYDSLCVGACTGTGDIADVYDRDGDIGTSYATSRKYPAMAGSLYDAVFWDLYPPLLSGTHPATDHEQLNTGNYDYSANKLGMHRWYRYDATAAGSVTITVSNPGASACTTNVMDMIVRKGGAIVTSDTHTGGANAGCPTVTFTAAAGDTFVIDIYGNGTNVSGFDLTVTP